MNILLLNNSVKTDYARESVFRLRLNTSELCTCDSSVNCVQHWRIREHWRLALGSIEHLQSVDNSRNISQYCQEDIDEEVGVTSYLTSVLPVYLLPCDYGGALQFVSETSDSKETRCRQYEPLSKKTPRGGRITASTILQISLKKYYVSQSGTVRQRLVGEAYLAVKGIAAVVDLANEA